MSASLTAMTATEGHALNEAPHASRVMHLPEPSLCSLEATSLTGPQTRYYSFEAPKATAQTSKNDSARGSPQAISSGDSEHVRQPHNARAKAYARPRRYPKFGQSAMVFSCDSPLVRQSQRIRAVSARGAALEQRRKQP